MPGWQPGASPALVNQFSKYRDGPPGSTSAPDRTRLSLRARPVPQAPAVGEVHDLLRGVARSDGGCRLTGRLARLTTRVGSFRIAVVLDLVVAAAQPGMEVA